MTEVLVTEFMGEEGLEQLRNFGWLTYAPRLWEDLEALQEQLGDVEALIVRNQTRVDAALLEHSENLRVVGRLGVGLDNIDLEAAHDQGIPVISARNANAISVAEYVVAAMLDAARSLRVGDSDIRKGNWDRSRFTGTELYGKTIGLVGVGEIARRVARRARAFGMDVMGYDPYVAPYDYPVAETGVELASFDSLLGRADFVSIHLPFNQETHHLFSIEAFGKMRQGAWLINTSRGGIIDEAALAQALEGGELGGAVLDVLDEEPASLEHPLLECDNVILTPHIAGLTEESQLRTSLLVAGEVIRVLKGESSLCTVT